MRESQEIGHFTEVEIFNKRISGLLDSGVSTACIRDKLTADGKIQATKRLVKAVMFFRAMDKSTEVFTVLSLSCPLFFDCRKVDDFHSLNESQKLELHTTQQKQPLQRNDQTLFFNIDSVGGSSGSNKNENDANGEQNYSRREKRNEKLIYFRLQALKT
uniref:Uncharacterized protein n=1 Tax=Glossina austeni TaxID=7395 RepID=A0A1A9VCN8_GLOAU